MEPPADGANENEEDAMMKMEDMEDKPTEEPEP